MEISRIRLSVIVLFYHGERWIDTCIRSLEAQSLSTNLYEIVVVDNGGSTPSVDKYKGKKNVHVLHFPVNYGFAHGNNRALEQAGGEIVVLMNQDVVVHYHCLEELLNAFDRYPEAGAICANMLMVSSDDVIDPYSSAPDAVGLYKLTRLGYASYVVKKPEEPVMPVDFVSGNGLGFRRSVVKDLGNHLFDSRLGSYMEDLDLSIRLKRTKWKMYVRPAAVVYHYRDEAFSGRPSHMLRKLIHVSCNRLIVYYNNLAGSDF
jgi:GT2 family glycosyltransferase